MSDLVDVKGNINVPFCANDVFEVLKTQLSPALTQCRDSFLNHLLGQEDSGKQRIICGGLGSEYSSLHENLFAWLYPELKRQVVFGTGKGGKNKYLTCRYVADFYDEQNKVIYEIDGTSHKSRLQKIKDKIRDYFFWNELRIRTIRLTNEEVVERVKNYLSRLEKLGMIERLMANGN